MRRVNGAADLGIAPVEVSTRSPGLVGWLRGRASVGTTVLVVRTARRVAVLIVGTAWRVAVLVVGTAWLVAVLVVGAAWLVAVLVVGAAGLIVLSPRSIALLVVGTAWAGCPAGCWDRPVGSAADSLADLGVNCPGRSGAGCPAEAAANCSGQAGAGCSVAAQERSTAVPAVRRSAGHCSEGHCSEGHCSAGPARGRPAGRRQGQVGSWPGWVGRTAPRPLIPLRSTLLLCRYRRQPPSLRSFVSGTCLASSSKGR